MKGWVRPEYRLLIAAAAGDPPVSSPTSGLDWDEALRLAAHHRLEGMLDAYLRRFELSVPEGIAARLRDRRHLFGLSEIRARVQLGELSATLQGAGVKSVALKGAALLDSVYREVGLRPLGDLDLLIAPHDLTGALDALMAAGYEERSAAPPSRAGVSPREHHHHAPLRHPGHPHTVELHLRPTFAGRSQAAPVLAGAYPSPRDGRMLPDPSDHLVILAAHFITDREVGSLAALGQLVDIARTAGESRLDHVAERAAGWRLTWETFAALDAVGALGLCQLPDTALVELRPASWNGRTTWALLRHRVLVDSPVSMTPRQSPPGLRASLIPGQCYLRARYGMSSASATQLYLAHARGLARRARPLVMAAVRHPRRSAGEIILARRVRGR